MDTVFLFSKHLNEEGCLCLKLDADGAPDAPASQLSFAEIRNLQQDCDTLVVETATHASLLALDLPWLPERKARTAIPYALEEKLAQAVDELHFAFDKSRYQNSQYLITVISKQRMQFIMQLLTEKDIQFSAITIDWFALEPEEICTTETSLLINTKDFKGALSSDLADVYLKNNPQIKNQDVSHAWIARRLLKTNPMNLCQGEIQHGSKVDWIKKSYQLAGLLFSLWLVSLILVNAIDLYFLNKKTTQIDEKIAEIYHEFFPGAKQVISPKFRIGQLLKGNGSEDNHFWFLLNQFSKLMDNKQFTLEQLRYQNKTLSVTLLSADFASLEKLETALKQAQLNVKQTQASTRDQQVVATLELT